MSSLNQRLDKFLRERLMAIDGMAVTAEVWNEAHDYHRHAQAAHTSYLHGAGIINGLGVLANDPADPQIVHIKAGVAVDQQGQLIIYSEDSAFLLGDRQGLLYVVLSYDGESEVAPGRQSDSSGEPRYLRIDFRVKAVNQLPETPYVELARLLRTDLTQPVRNAVDPAQPGAQELDLRFRNFIGVHSRLPVALGLVSLDRNISPQHWRGWLNLTCELRNASAQQVWAQPNVRINQEMGRYPLLCLVGQREVELNQAERHHLYEYLRNGGVVYYESCRRELRYGDAPADKSFLELITWMGGQITEAPLTHSLYHTPHLFVQLPDGYEARPPAPLQIVKGIGNGLVIISKNDYGCVWSGSRRDRPLTRAELRDAFEWGDNLLTFALGHNLRPDQS